MPLASSTSTQNCYDIQPYMACFHEVFGFYPDNYLDEHRDNEQKKQALIPAYRVLYPLHFYIPKSRFETGCDSMNWSQYRYTPYKRISHFREHLNRLQYCQFVTVPSMVFDVVRNTYPRTYQDFKNQLKQNKLSHYNEHIHYLLSYFNQDYLKIDYPDFHQMCTLFVQLDHLFKNEKNDINPRRKNFISYYIIVQWILYMFHYHPHYNLPSLKDSHKRQYYYIFLLNLFSHTPLYQPILEQHFRRKRDCQVCQELSLHHPTSQFDVELLSLL